MSDKFILAIPDTHTEPAGRQRALRLLKSGKIEVFFIEWPEPINRTDIERSFANLAKNDAEPSLKTLAHICSTKGIEVVSCDLSASETVERLNALNDGYAPYGLNSAFQPWGKGIRDNHAADVIAKYLNLHPKKISKALLMFGADHFKAETGRGAEPLHKLIKKKTGIDCFLLNRD